MGRFNSSLTRVKPTFNALYKKDPTGQTWLLDLLRLGNRDENQLPELGVLQRPPAYEFCADPPKQFSALAFAQSR